MSFQLISPFALLPQLASSPSLDGSNKLQYSTLVQHIPISSHCTQVRLRFLQAHELKRQLTRFFEQCRRPKRTLMK